MTSPEAERYNRGMWLLEQFSLNRLRRQLLQTAPFAAALADAESLPFGNGRFHTIVGTLVFCSLIVLLPIGLPAPLFFPTTAAKR